MPSLAATASVDISISSTLDADSAALRKAGYIEVGLADTVSRGNSEVVVDPRSSLREELLTLARTIGAEKVLFCIWPAKLRAIRRDERGLIDLWAVIDDLPARGSPRGFYVTRYMFFARKARPSYICSGGPDA
jgi:hypothetical protein